MKIDKLKETRLHDDIYLRGKPVIKESFKFLFKEILMNQKKFESLIDIGCSNGAFLSYARSKLKYKKLYRDLVGILETSSNSECLIQTKYLSSNLYEECALYLHQHAAQAAPLTFPKIYTKHFFHLFFL